MGGGAAQRDAPVRRKFNSLNGPQEQWNTRQCEPWYELIISISLECQVDKLGLVSISEFLRAIQNVEAYSSNYKNQVPALILS